MFKYIIIGVLFIILLSCLPFRLFISNLFNSLKYLFSDIYLFVKHRSWRVAPVGFINAYTGLFGQGKTLSAVHYAAQYFKRYNNVIIYDFSRKKFVKQYVNIISNVQLNIPYTEFYSLSQIVETAENVAKFNEDNDCKLITLVIGDEFSTQLNSRNFKSNLDAFTLNAILTCRHHGISLIYTAQRFGHVDALLRQVTSKVYECKKLWRFECHNVYDAWDLEQAGSSLNLKPVKRAGFFVTDKDYNAYNSLAVVKNLVKAWSAGDLFGNDDILKLLGDSEKSMDNIRRTKRSYRKRKSA